MSLMDELRRLARPYEDEEDYEEDFELEEPFVETKEERKTRGRKREEDDMERDYADTSRDKVVNINTTTQLQVVLVKPEKFQDASAIADHLRDKRTVVLNLESANKDVARRMVDFLVRRSLCPGREDQEGGGSNLYYHTLQRGYHRRLD